MRTNHTDITVVLDRSGSMSLVAEDTIGGFNRFLKDQQEAPGTAVITLNQFDDQFENVINCKDVKSAEPLTNKTFVPRGNTALLDAVARSINEAGKRFESMPEHDRPSRVVVVIITDGQENASHEFSHAKVQDMIKHQQDVYKWEFVFIGANMNAKEYASNLNIPADNAIKYAHNKLGTQAAFASTSSNLRSMRSGSKVKMNFEPGDYAAQVNAGVNK